MRKGAKMYNRRNNLTDGKLKNIDFSLPFTIGETYPRSAQDKNWVAPSKVQYDESFYISD